MKVIIIIINSRHRLMTKNKKNKTMTKIFLKISYLMAQDDDDDITTRKKNTTATTMIRDVASCA